MCICCFFFSSRRRHTRFKCDWSSDVCSSDLAGADRAESGASVPYSIVIGTGEHDTRAAVAEQRHGDDIAGRKAVVADGERAELDDEPEGAHAGPRMREMCRTRKAQHPTGGGGAEGRKG